MAKASREEKTAEIQSRSTIHAVVISSSFTLIATLITAFFAFPPFQEWVRSWGNDSKGKTLAIEQIPQQVFAYYGEAENVGGFARLELIFEGNTGKPSYELSYNLPEDRTGYTGTAFLFGEGTNLSGYNAVECTLTFSRLTDVVDLYFKDIAGNFNTIRVSNNGVDEMMLRYEFTNFPKINFNAVKEFGVVISTEFSTGSHKVRIKNVHFVE